MTEASDGWYMRARGRILGPFTRTQLGSLRDRGQLSQFHELSQDRRNWVNATAVDGLFGRPAASVAARRDVTLVEVAPSPIDTPAWFYGVSDRPYGPLTHEQIVELIQAGQIRPDTPIWREGYPGWLELRDVPEFASLAGVVSGSGGFSRTLLDSEAGEGGPAVAPSIRRARLTRALMVAAVLVVLGVLAGLALFAIERDRERASRPAASGPPDRPAAGPPQVDGR